MNPLDAIKFVTTNGTLPANQSLADIVGAEPYARVSKLAAVAGSARDRDFETRALVGGAHPDAVRADQNRIRSALGIDMQITERARTDGKPIEGLETVIDQLSVFDACSFEEQTRFLLDSAEDVPKLSEDLQDLIVAWRNGNLRALEKAFVEERAKSPQLYDALLGVRNRQWLPKIEALLKEDRDYLVVVGALHFVGRDGLLALLEQGWPQARGRPSRQETKKLSLNPCAPSRSSSG